MTITAQSPLVYNRRVFVRLCAASPLAYCSYAMCRSPLLPLFARHLGASAPRVGFVMAASTITGALLKLPAGTLSDVLGRRTLLLVGGIVFAVLPFAYLPVAALGWLIALRVVHGSATAIFGPVAAATISDVAPADRRGRWLSAYSTAQSAGQAAGALLAGMLLAPGGFHPTFLVSGVLGALALVLITRQARGPRRSPSARWFSRSVDAVRSVSTDPRILTVSLVQAGQFVVYGSLNAFVPLFGTEALHLSTRELGVVLAAQTIATLVARPASGVLSDRKGRRSVIAVGLLLSASAVAMVAAATGFGSLLAAMSLYGAGSAVTSSGTTAYVTDLADRSRYGATHGIFGTVYDIGDAAGPIVAGLLVSAAGYRVTFGYAAGFVVLLVLMFACTGNSRPSPTTNPPAVP